MLDNIIKVKKCHQQTSTTINFEYNVISFCTFVFNNFCIKQKNKYNYFENRVSCKLDLYKKIFAYVGTFENVCISNIGEMLSESISKFNIT